MAGINKVILVGHLGKDPEPYFFEGGNKKATFSIATSETYKDKTGNKVSQTEWHNIVCWGALADIAIQYLKKGMQVYLEGKIKSRSWDDDKGQKKYITEIVANTFQMLGAKSSNENQQSPPFDNQNKNVSETNDIDILELNEPMDDDLPF